MSFELSEILFKEYRRKVLGLLLLRPDETFHVREIARRTNTVPGTLHKELSNLARVGLLIKSVQINQVTYRANTSCVIYPELVSILRKTSGLADVLAAQLESVASKLHVAAVFGSLASNRASQTSDVDLLIVGEIEFGEVTKLLYPTQETLGREINPKVYSLDEWKRAMQDGSEFARSIVANPLIFIVGNQDDLGEPARHIA